ncbi:ATP-dependent DNA helicase [Orbaceae bacterium ac157xtp]
MIDDFAPDGLLAQAIANFVPRKPQQKMAQMVKHAIEHKEPIVVEAGTGTGKTFAYLVPALRCDKKVIISTGSKNLQDQLYTKDLPIIKKALGYTGKIALLKGRSNYLCLERLSNNNGAAGDLAKNLQADLVKVKKWASKTTDGDISKCTTVIENSAIWPLLTSTNDNCYGSECPQYDDCWVAKARRRALNADVVVVNHHLFLADVIVKDSGFGELIPKADVLIFDEAHQIPDLACEYFGFQLTSRQLLDLAKEIMLCYRTEIKDMVQLQKCADKLQKSTQDTIISISNHANQKGNIRDLLRIKPIAKEIDVLKQALIFCQEVLSLAVGRTSNVDNYHERVKQYLTLLEQVFVANEKGFSFWYENGGRHFTFGITPLSVSQKFSNLMFERNASWIFTSATLAVNQNLDYFTKRLGLGNAKSLILESPFDYATQTLFCVPRYIPSPNERGGAEKLATTLLPIIEANKGRCFFLCTSYSMMNDLAAIFKEQLTLPVLVQGETSKTLLLEQFIEYGNALLVATSSFWEGIDVPGDTLSCVIIDKLPFTAPDDPLMKARIEDCRSQGGNPFAEIQIPEAVITLKQGVGRLIRHHNDHGAIIICDNRLVMRPYGATFINSLPPSPRTRDVNKVVQFLLSYQSAT